MVRFKNRWLLVEFIPCMDGAVSLHHQLTRGGTEITGKHVWSALKQSVISNFGDAGWGAVGYSLTVKYFSPVTNLCIIRVGREHVRTAWGAVTLLNSIEGRKVLPNVVHVSGTIKHAQLAAVTHNRETIARFDSNAAYIAERAETLEQFLQTSSAEIQALTD